MLVKVSVGARSIRMAIQGDAEADLPRDPDPDLVKIIIPIYSFTHFLYVRIHDSFTQKKIQRIRITRLSG